MSSAKFVDTFFFRHIEVFAIGLILVLYFQSEITSFINNNMEAFIGILSIILILLIIYAISKSLVSNNDFMRRNHIRGSGVAFCPECGNKAKSGDNLYICKKCGNMFKFNAEV